MQSSNKGCSTESSFIPEIKKGLFLVVHSLDFLSVILCAWNRQGISFKHDKEKSPNSYKPGLKEHWETFGIGVTGHISGLEDWDGDLLCGPCHSSSFPSAGCCCPRHSESSWGRKARGRKVSALGAASPCLWSLLRTVPGLASRWYRLHTSRQKSFARGINRRKKSS